MENECSSTKRFTDPVRTVKCQLPEEHAGVHLHMSRNDSGVYESYGWGSTTKEEQK